MAEAPSAERLFVEVKGFLELVNTVDADGNRTNEQPLLLKLINAPPPLTPAEANAIRKSAADAEKARASAVEAQAEMKKAHKQAMTELAKKTKEMEENAAKLEAETKKARDAANREKEAGLREQRQAKVSIAKAEQDAASAIERLKAELARTQTESEAKVKAAVEKTQSELKSEKRAAEEMMQQANEKAKELREELERLQNELAEHKKQSAAAAAPPPPPSPISIKVEEPRDVNDGAIDRMIDEHNAWRNEFERLSAQGVIGQPIVNPAMPDEELAPESIVVEQVLDLQGNEIFPPRSHFVSSAADDDLYHFAMRNDNPGVRDRILQQLAEKRSALNAKPYARPPRAWTPTPEMVNKPREEPSATRLVAPQPWHSFNSPVYQRTPPSSHSPLPVNIRMHPMKPSGPASWFCCKDTRNCCSPCCSPPGPGNHHHYPSR